MACVQCKDSLPRDEDYVSCGKCTKAYHYDCSGVKKTTWMSKSAKLKSEWACPQCRTKKNRTQSVDEEQESEDPTYLALKKLLEVMFKKQEQAIIERVDTITALVNHIEEKFLNVLDNVKELETKTLSLQNDIQELKTALEMEKQYGRSKNFIITNIPYSEKEDVGQKVSDLLAVMDIQLKKEDITTHRLPSSKKPAPIIVQCTTRAVRDVVVRKARKFRPKVSLINKNQPDVPIFFNDHLTPYFSDLMAKANQIRKNKGYSFIWMNGNRIMVKKGNLFKAIQITSTADLDKIL